MNPILSTIAFFVSQLIFTPSFLSITNACTKNTTKPLEKKFKYNILFLFLSPLATYIYATILMIFISQQVKNDTIMLFVSSLSDVFIIILSFICANIYTKICMNLSKWYKVYYMTIYLFFTLFQMAFNWTYNTVFGTVLCNICIPICAIFYFNKYVKPTFLKIKQCKHQTKPTITLIVLFLISMGLFVLRSIVIMITTHVGIDIATNSIILNTLITVFTYLILAFLFVGTTTIITNIQHTQIIEHQSKTNIQLTNDMITALVRAIDIKDKYTKGHSVRVAQYSRMIAERYYHDPKTIQKIYQIALLHDIGKLGIPDQIINKPGKLTDEEYDIIKSHTTKGEEILFEIKSLPELIYGAKYHHERYDGKGYPNGLSGNQIPEIAALIAVADAYDTMTSKRSYKDIMPQAIVKEEIKKNIGTQFHPEFARIMLDIINEDTNYKLHQ